jgi:hypothetical protein
MILSVCAVCAAVVNVASMAYLLIQESALGLAQPSAHSIPDSNIEEDETGYSTTPAYRAMLAERLGIPDHVTVRLHHAPLPHAYVRYKEFNIAHNKLQNMITSRTWIGKTPLKRDLMEVFARKSTFYKDHIVLFSQVHQFPDLKQWLEEDEDALTGIELFGVAKQLYIFRDLRDYIGRTKPGQRKKRRASVGLVGAGKKARTADVSNVKGKDAKTRPKVKDVKTGPKVTKGKAGGSRQTGLS